MVATSGGIVFGIIPIFLLLLYLGLAGLFIYCLILFIRLAHRGIRALDLYIHHKQTYGDSGSFRNHP